VLPASWYLACSSHALKRGRIVTLPLLENDIVVYRAASGRVHAVHAQCTHMGTHLRSATVAGEGLRCAMHHRVYEPGAGPAVRNSCLRQRAYPVVERAGGVFVFAGEHATFDVPPVGDAHDGVAVVTARPQPLTTSWATLTCNAFDIEHMQAVHHRVMKKKPEAVVLDRHVLELRYVSRVTGTGVSDRIIKRLSDDTICVTIRCWGGTLLTVRSEVGRLVSHLLLCFTPTPHGALITPMIAVPKGRIPGVALVRAYCSRWLFLTFLKRDLEPLAGMQLNVANALAAPGPLGVCAEWLTHLPEAVIAPPKAAYSLAPHAARS
jgi:nitrite reductase/ring-hydroxylating ferredoxin subunit